MIANALSPMHWFILIVVCLVVFGAKRLPDIARNIGKSIGELKKVRQEFEDAAMQAETRETKKAIVEPSEEKAPATEVAAEEKKESDPQA